MNVDLTTKYLGLELKNPLVAAASPLTAKPESLQQLEEAGAAAVVLPSLFEEQIEHEQWAVYQLHEFQTESFAESLDYFPALDTYNTGPDSYLDKIKFAKKMMEIPVIASLNGGSSGGWTRYARMIEDAGADALELNIYMVPTSPGSSGREVEARYLELVSAVRQSISIPLAVKTGPYFSSIPDMARRLVEAGVNGLVLFNRYLEPDIDLNSLDVVPHLVLSRRDELHLPLRWIAILHGQVEASLAATSGIHEGEDVIKVLLAGADIAMMASALLQQGPQHLSDVLQFVKHWLEERGYQSVRQMQGSVSRMNCSDPRSYERSNYMKALISWSGKPI
jgi:dihydroorotate dehydrogenase (fumarate)